MGQEVAVPAVGYQRILRILYGKDVVKAEMYGTSRCTGLEQYIGGAAEYGPFDLVLEATGNSGVVFESMRALAKNGALVLASVTGGDKRIEVPADKINLEFVLGNKLMLGTVNASREDFEQGVRDMIQAEATFPGFLKQFLTHPIDGLESVDKLFDALTNAKDAIKVYCVVGTNGK